ncbi:MAG TPA: VWA domain-containing protein [Bryobacteraceae bacterium]|nr:VWA domain-containing protein [Bryobacteraceae bacterium]
MKKQLLALAAVSAAICPAQKDSMIHTESRLVVVDALVTDRKGGYPGDLTQKDFRVWEDGKEQTLTTFSKEANSQKHNVILFFDDATITPARQHVARDAANRFVEANASPSRTVAVVEYSGDLRVSQNFTDDKDRLRQALNRTNTAGPARTAPTVNGPANRNDPGAAYNSYSARGLMRSFLELADRVAGLPGRKTVILFSEGFRASSDDMRLVTEACNRANIALYPVDVRGTTSIGVPGMDVNADLDPSNGVSSTRPQDGGRAIPGRSERIGDPVTPNPDETLDALARNTGGFLLSRIGDLEGGMDRIGKEEGSYYVLGYVPTKEPDPGACHSLKVKVDRGGMNVRARSQYCEARALDVLAGTATQRDLESRLTGNTSSTIEASVQAPFFYTGENTVRVDLALDVSGNAVRFTKDKGKFTGNLNVVGIAYLEDGSVGARFSDNVRFSFDDKQQVEEFASKPYHYEKQFPIGSGNYNLKIAFSAGEGFGKVDLPLAVQPWDPSRFWLSGLALSTTTARPASGGSLSLGPSVFGDKVPLVVNGVQIIPTGTNRLHKSEKAYLYAEIYDPTLAPAEVQAQFLDAKSGKVAKDLGSTQVNTSSVTELKAVPFGLTLPLEDLAPGQYALKVTALQKGSKIGRQIEFELLP